MDKLDTYKSLALCFASILVFIFNTKTFDAHHLMGFFSFFKIVLLEFIKPSKKLHPAARSYVHTYIRIYTYVYTYV